MYLSHYIQPYLVSSLLMIVVSHIDIPMLIQSQSILWPCDVNWFLWPYKNFSLWKPTNIIKGKDGLIQKLKTWILFDQIPAKDA